jgi:1,4-dihydroxy-2-naphthoate octaprenyltransferase
MIDAAGQHSIKGLFALLVPLALYLAYIVYINDFFDMPYDKLAGKKRTIYYLPKTITYSLAITIVSVSYITTIVFVRQPLFLTIFTVAYLLGTLYSAPPVRFKERGFLGILCDVLIEKALPAILVFSYFDYFNFDAWFFIVLCFLLQVEVILRHQIEDYEVDLKTQVRTFVMSKSATRTLQVLNVYLRPIVALLILIFSLIALMKIPLLAPVFGLLAIIFFITNLFVRKGTMTQENPQVPFYFKFVYIYFVSTLPLSLTLLVVWRFGSYMFLLPIVFASQFSIYRYYLKPIKSLVGLRSHTDSSTRKP